MKMLMCRSCGRFVKAREEAGLMLPLNDACPDCDETRFKDIDSGRMIDTTQY